MDRLEELATLVAIIEAGSLVAASRRLQRSPPAVTRVLAGLEDRMGLRLVERTTRRLSPTEAGSALAERARSLLADYEQLLAGASQARHRGVLRITAPVQFGRRHVAPIVSAVLNEHPDVRIELMHAHCPIKWLTIWQAAHWCGCCRISSPALCRCNWSP